MFAFERRKRIRRNGNISNKTFLYFRIWWIIAFILSTVLCFYAIRNLYFKWERRPVIVSFDDKTTPVATIPFPAVTICTTKKFTKDYVDTDLFQNILIEMETNATAYKNHKPEMYEHIFQIVTF